MYSIFSKKGDLYGLQSGSHLKRWISSPL